MDKADEKKLLKYGLEIKSMYGNVSDLNKCISLYAKNKGINATYSDICYIVRQVILDNSPTPAVLDVITAKQLSESNLPALQFCVDEILSHGVGIVSAKSKMFKSWMAMQLCLCVCNGEPFLGYKTHRSDCLYIDLENDLRLTKERLSLMLGDKESPNNFMIVNDVPTMEQGFIATMEKFISNNAGVKLIVIDIFAKIKYQKKSNQSDYDADYKSISELKAFASKYDLTILLIAHNRKMVDTSDPFSNILGSTALMGACDESIVIYKEKRSDKESTISITGRTVQSHDYKAIFDTDKYQWRLLGSLDDYEEKQVEIEYNTNPIIHTIKKLLEESENGSWCGRLNELIEKSRDYGNLICDSSQAIGRKMPKIKAQLSQYDGIRVKTMPNGSGSKKYEFTKTV